jgi:hypothetical protein
LAIKLFIKILLTFFIHYCIKQYSTFNRRGNGYPLHVDMGKMRKEQLNRFIGKGGSIGENVPFVSLEL